MKPSRKSARDCKSLTALAVDSYGALAQEYYSRDLHPTCANMATASRALLARWLAETPLRGRICEVGAGRSALAEVLDESAAELDLVLTDQSIEMLRHSLWPSTPKPKLVVCDATSLPFRSGSMDGIVSLLGDPYNSDGFWKEVFRVLKQNGHAIFTTPSWKWATTFRSKSARERNDAALFVTRSGEVVYTPSFVVPELEQVKLITNAGLQVRHVAALSLGELRQLDSTLSPKFADYLSDGDAVVTAFWVLKQ